MIPMTDGLTRQGSTDFFGQWAVLSDCGRYRYALARPVPRELGTERKTCVFVMLNPSTADAFVDDPTIRRCLSFAARLACDHLVVVNQFAWRATKPTELGRTDDPIGQANPRIIDWALESRRLAPRIVIAAWGATTVRGREPYQRAVHAQLADAAAQCLGLTAAGQPRHPLYVRGDAPLIDLPAVKP